MSASVRRRRPARVALATTVAALAGLVVAAPVGAFSSKWTKPKKVFAYDGRPTHASAIDSHGHVHIATEKGKRGIHYITNKSGSWTTCQLSTGNDRYPSIVASGDVAHIAFARTDTGERGLYTASTDQPAPGATGCDVALVERYSGGAGSSAIGIANGTLHIAFRTTKKKLKYTKGAPANPAWTVLQTIDGLCCTSKPAMAFTTTGSVRIAYGDGSKKPRGLKFALRSGGKWKKSLVTKGRVKHVDLVLDHSPGVFTPPSNAPIMAYVKKKAGTYLGSKSKPNAKGSWSIRRFGGQQGATGVTHWSNQTRLLLSGGGKLYDVVGSGGIWATFPISKNGKDGKPVFHGSHLTFSRKGTGVFHTRRK